MFLPTTLDEVQKRGWNELDFILITPDAYIDHPSFAMAILGRVLEARGFRVGILSQPRWQNPESFLALGVPRLAFGISGGNVDSMVLNFTPSGKRRMEDEYCEEGKGYFPGTEPSVKNKIRPDRVITVYANQLKQACKTKPVIIGGLEASLRRIAHYDYWSNSVKRSVLFDAKADVLVYGMGEEPLTQILLALQAGKSIEDLQIPNTAVIQKSLEGLENPLVLPSFEAVKSDKKAFAQAFKLFYENEDRQILAQMQDSRYLVQYPKGEASPGELDWIYSLPYERAPHPSYQKPIPAFNMIRDSVTAHRGCYGKCAFCSLHLHQGAKIISRSRDSILNEVKTAAHAPGFKGTISDIGGPSANMYASQCRIGGCQKPDCLMKDQGKPCPELIPGLKSYAAVLSDASKIHGVKQVFIGSGLRFDPPLMNEEFLGQVLECHSSGQIKVAPESGSDGVLALMHKPAKKVFEGFRGLVNRVLSQKRLVKKIVPYIIIGHPGEKPEDIEETLRFLKAQNLSGNPFQIFTPTPLTLATAMYYLEENPLTGEKVPVEKNMKTLESRKARLTQRPEAR